MKNNYLSQEEIDSLLKKKESVENAGLNNQQKDILGEVGNISMSTAATTLSSIINTRVNITTPKVEWISIKKILEECNIPKVVSQIEFHSGLNGINVLMMDVNDAAIIANLMMGGNGKNPNKILSELELSAVAEAMNQMVGSASTSMATMLNKSIDINPPSINIWNKDSEINIKNITEDMYIVKIAFKLTVEGLIDSEIMQFYTMDIVNEIVSIMMGSLNEEKQEKVIIPKEQDKSQSQQNDQVVLQKPIFSQLEQSNKTDRERNIDLILDVPLEFSVVLGKTKKSIHEILSLSTGSIVELNKFAEEPLEIYVNGKLIAEGEVVVINDNFGVRITNILSKEKRVEKLR